MGYAYKKTSYVLSTFGARKEENLAQEEKQMQKITEHSGETHTDALCLSIVFFKRKLDLGSRQGGRGAKQEKNKKEEQNKEKPKTTKVLDRLDAVLEIGVKSCVAGTGSVRQTPKEDVETLRGRRSAGKDEFMAQKRSWKGCLMIVPKSWTHCSSRNHHHWTILPATSVCSS